MPDKSRSTDDTDRAAFWTLSPDEVVTRFETDPDQGLSPSEAKARLARHGPNVLQERDQVSALSIFFDQWKNLIVALLAGAAGLAFAFGQLLEGASVCIALLLNVLIGFTTEYRAMRSMQALSKLGRVRAGVRRGGRTRRLPAEKIVPGDVVVLESGDVVPADLRLVEANRIQADESALTGESVPVSKSEEAAPEDAPLSERTSMVFKGTALTMGSGLGVAVATGMQTEVGHISHLAEEAEEEQAPLQRRLALLGRRLVWLTLGVAAAVAVGGIATGMEPLLIVETSIALAVAAIPEGLPIVATVALARGMWRMARRNAVITRLAAVETLGAVTTVCTDKTGTLTENQMTLDRLVLPGDNGLRTLKADASDAVGDETSRRAMLVGALCANAELGDDNESTGDPMELALIRAYAQTYGSTRRELLDELPEVREEAFSRRTRMMATVHESGEGYLYAVKGAPEAVLDACTRLAGPEGGHELDETTTRNLLEENQALAEQGLRVLALAEKRSESPDDAPYEELVFLGLAGLMDPPRKGVAETVKRFARAGIRVVMVTGDQPATALAVAKSVGVADEDSRVEQGRTLEEEFDALGEPRIKELNETPVFARVSPEQKLELVRLFQRGGNVIAMTGDGVNDAPALKKADIGIAMGKRGTEVAREAADMVLGDDRFETIGVAVEQGRVIFANIRRFIVYLLSGNVGEIMIVAAAMALAMPLPLLPLQILYLNMLSDVFPALALGMGGHGGDVMARPPRDSSEPLLTGTLWWRIAGYGALIAATVLGTFALALGALHMDEPRAVTVSFLTLAFARTWHTFNMRDAGSGPFVNSVTRNPYVWGAVAICIILLVAATYLPGLSTALSMHAPGREGWLLILAGSAAPLVVVQTAKSLWPGKGIAGG